MKGRHEKREFFMNGIGMPLKLGIAEGELENHVHLERRSHQPEEMGE